MLNAGWLTGTTTASPLQDTVQCALQLSSMGGAGGGGGMVIDLGNKRDVADCRRV